jgi:hypothetical protein
MGSRLGDNTRFGNLFADGVQSSPTPLASWVADGRIWWRRSLVGAEAPEMPIGCYSLVPMIANRLHDAQPRSVLDLGVGKGFYGAVVRQWLDLGVRAWRTKLFGV